MTPSAARVADARRQSAKRLAPRRAPSRTPWWQNGWLAASLLVVVTLTLYHPVSGYGFVDYDDGFYVTDNVHVQAGLSWASIRWALRSTEYDNWHPVTWLSHLLDYEWYGASPGGHHMTSVLIHVVNVILLFLLLRRVTGQPGRSFLVAALFAWHPFNVESVVWIAERKNVLSTLFLLLTLAAYGWYARRPDGNRYAWVAILFALGLAAKPMLVTVPLLLMLLDYWPLQRIAGWTEVSDSFPVVQFPVRRVLLEKMPLLLLSAASAVITVIAQQRGGTIRTMEILPLAARAQNALLSYGRYLWKVIWPSGFAIHYPNPFDPTLSSRPTLGTWLSVIGAGLLLVAVSVLAWQQRRKRPFLLAGWLWYLGSLVPVIGIVQVGMQGMADRYAYVPLLGIFVILVWGVDSLSPPNQNWRWGMAIAIPVALVVLSYRQIGRWESNYTLWLHAANVTDGNFLADNHLGMILQQEGNPGALSYFEEAARIAPWDPVSHSALAIDLEDQGQHQEALQVFESVIGRPMRPELLALAKANVGIIYGELGEYSKSRDNLQQAQRTDPLVIDNLVQGFSQSLAMRSADDTYLRLGIVLEQTGHKDQARAAYEKVLQRNPGSRDAQKLLHHLDEGG